MKALFENSLFVRLLMCLRAWYHEGAIAGFFNRIRQAYPGSVFCRLWNKFCATPICTSANSIYARILAALRRFVEKLGGIAANSLIYRICLAVWRPIERVAGGGLIGRACRFVGMRGLLLLGLGETFVRLIERVRHLLRTVIEHLGNGAEQEFLHQHEQDEQINKHPDNLRI